MVINSGKTKTNTNTNPNPDPNRYRRRCPDPNARIQKFWKDCAPYCQYYPHFLKVFRILYFKYFKKYLFQLWSWLCVQMNCCGASGPDDYRNSAWFNRSRPVEEVFVPSSCCVSAVQSPNVGDRRRDALPLLPRPADPHDQDSCQLNAILFPNNDKLSHSLRTQVYHTDQITIVITIVILFVHKKQDIETHH